MRSRVANAPMVGAPPNAAPSGYNVEVTSLATDGRTSRDHSRVTDYAEVIQMSGRTIASGLPTIRELCVFARIEMPLGTKRARTPITQA